MSAERLQHAVAAFLRQEFGASVAAIIGFVDILIEDARRQALDGFTPDLERMLPAMVEARVDLIEQPVPVGEDAQLEGLASPIPIAADESVQSRVDLLSLAGRYQVANIKLDKSGGLTEGLAMAQEARSLGLKVMVGCMSGTSLSIAPAFVLGQLCDFVDLDGPTFLRSDRETPATYAGGKIWCPDELWGAPNPPSPSEVRR